jgi:Skp family chaperone for outer membrane proteins
MNRIIFIAAAFVVLLSTAVMASAQTRPATPAATTPAAQTAVPAVNVPPTKIGLVDTTVFSDEKIGILRYVRAVKSVQAEFVPRSQELVTLQARMKALSEEIAKLAAAPIVSQETITAKRDEGERLQREFKYKQEQIDADAQKRLAQVVSPISTEIGKALEEFANQRGLTLTLDVSKLMPALLTVNPAMDVTTAFVADYNAKHP